MVKPLHEVIYRNTGWCKKVHLYSIKSKRVLHFKKIFDLYFDAWAFPCNIDQDNFVKT